MYHILHVSTKDVNPARSCYNTATPCYSFELIMKKELLFAMSIGLCIGLIITFGMYRARVAMTTNTTVNRIDGTLPTPPVLGKDEEKSNTDAFVVSQPLDEALLSDPKIQVTGQTYPNAVVVILQEASEIVGQSDAKGNFSIPITLDAGANTLVIRVLAENRDPLSVTRTVIFSTADLSAGTSTKTATPSSTPKTKIQE